MGMGVREQSEQRHLQPVLLRSSVTNLQKCQRPVLVTFEATDQRRKLEVISNQNKLFGEPEGTKACRQGDLGRFVDDQRLNRNDSRDLAQLAVEQGAQSG